MVVMIVRIGNSWIVRLANNPQIVWTFQGVNPAEQVANAKYLADSMKLGEQNVVNNIPEILQLGPNDQAQAVVNTLFSGTDGVQLNGLMAYSNADAMLIEVLEEAGARLATALLPF